MITATQSRARTQLRVATAAVLWVSSSLFAMAQQQTDSAHRSDHPRPGIVTSADPADPNTRAPLVDYRSTIAPFTSRRPVDPAPWREQNEHVTPAPNPGQ